MRQAKFIKYNEHLKHVFNQKNERFDQYMTGIKSRSKPDKERPSRPRSAIDQQYRNQQVQRNKSEMDEWQNDLMHERLRHNEHAMESALERRASFLRSVS